MSETMPSMSSGWSRMLSRTFEVYRSKFLTLIGITAVVFLPINLLNVLGQVFNTLGTAANNRMMQESGPFADPEVMTQLAAQTMSLSGVSLLISCCTLLAVILAYPLGYGALARAVCDGYLARAGGFGSAFRQAFKMWPRYVLVTLLVFAIGLLAGIWTIIPCVGWLTGPGLLMVLGIISGFAPIIIIMEQKGVIDTVRRSWDLLRRRFWHVLGLFLVVGGAMALVSVVLYGISSVLLNALGPELFPDWEVLDISGRISLNSTVFVVLSLPLILLVTPVYITLAGVVYYDLRTQTEGFDASAYAPKPAAGVEQISDLAGDAPGAETGNLITAREGGYTVILSIGAIVFYACFYAFILATNPEIMDMFR